MKPFFSASLPSVSVCDDCQTLLPSSLLCDEETRAVSSQLWAACVYRQLPSLPNSASETVFSVAAIASLVQLNSHHASIIKELSCNTTLRCHWSLIVLQMHQVVCLSTFGSSTCCVEDRGPQCCAGCVCAVLLWWGQISWVIHGITSGVAFRILLNSVTFSLHQFPYWQHSFFWLMTMKNCCNQSRSPQPNTVLKMHVNKQVYMQHMNESPLFPLAVIPTWVAFHMKHKFCCLLSTLQPDK